ncbi:MAG: hypothetical protein AAGF11_56215 [Myxococcota bacterium]
MCGNAAPSFRQSWYSKPRVKEHASEVLSKELMSEEGKEAGSSVAMALQGIIEPRFGRPGATGRAGVREGAGQGEKSGRCGCWITTAQRDRQLLANASWRDPGATGYV